VEDILLHGALVSGAFPVAREPLDLARGVIEPAWRMVLMQQSQRQKLERLQMTRAVAEDVPALIIGDGTRLTQVMTNVLSNSVKFTPEGTACARCLAQNCVSVSSAAHRSADTLHTCRRRHPPASERDGRASRVGGFFRRGRRAT
jgi:signal transduction histidine kinase